MKVEPLEITAGDRLSWGIYLTDYLPSDGWTLKYALRGPVSIDFYTTPDGDRHLVDVPGTTSKDYAPGTYSWARYVQKADGTRETITTGRMVVKPDLVAAGANFDGSSHAERVLAAIERVIEGRASKGDQELWFENKKLVKMTVAELLNLRQHYRLELNAEKKKQLAKSGRRTGRTIKFRM